ncbi:MAG: hypothetical protein QM484_04945 [Woeseiaceae bacterium]
MSKGYLGMLTLSITVLIISVASLSYILIEKPAYLNADRDGVPFYTPDVINPDNGKAVSLGELIRHYKGE